jgi:FtsP/CotA-like multicopper oxidase with cupredoxin domain
MHTRLVAALAAATLAVTSVACEGRTSGFLTTGPAAGVRVRLLNALTSSQSLAFVVDGQTASSGVGFGGASPYVSLTLGSHRLQAQASGTGTTLVDFTRDLNAEGAFSFVPAPGLSQFGALFIPDDPTPASGQAKLRVVHVAAAPGSISVYLTSPTADLSSATPIIPTLAFGAVSPYVAVAPGTFRIRVTPAGIPSTVLLDSGNLTLTSGAVRTLLVTDSPGGGLPTILSIISDAN